MSGATPKAPPPDMHDLFSDHETREPAPAADMLAARQAGLIIADLIIIQKQALDFAFETAKEFKTLPQRDRAFCRMMVSTMLRRLGQVDDMIAKAEDKPAAATRNPVLQNILRLGVTQILFMDVPDHAAVDTSVRLTESMGFEKQKAFVNAVLRTITREGREWVKLQDPTRLNTPEWLLKIWIEDYGLRTAAEIAQAHLAEAPLDITIKDETDRNHWNSVLKTTQLSTGTLRRIAGGAVHDMPGFDDGMWWIQDASAAIPARLFGDIKGQTVIDLCAAPGGKTMQLASRGAHVIAVDRSAQRNKRLKDNLERTRLQPHVEIVTSDAAEWEPREPARFVLVDAPCSATGTIRRHPDVPWLKTLNDVSHLADVQARILENAFRILEPDGVMIYCTCSLQKAEGERQISSFLERHPDAYRLSITAEEVGDFAECLTEDGDMRILPFYMAASGGMDGFFISRIKKTGSF